MLAFAVFCAVMTLHVGAAPQQKGPGPDIQRVRQAVERAVPYLEKEGLDWWKTNNCITCHQMPMMFWSLQDAHQRGFKVDQRRVADLRQEIVDQMSTRFPQGDKIKLVTDTYSILIWCMAQADLPAQTKQLFARYVDLFEQMQTPEGFWIDPSLHWKEASAKVKDGVRELDPYPPLIESDATKTMWTLLAGNRISKEKESWQHSRDRALVWLGARTAEMSHQELVMRVIVAREFGRKGEAEALSKRLLRLQRANGAWSQIPDGPGDSLATGQSLYALGLGDTTGHIPETRRARNFLLETQLQDGSWVVPTRNKGKPQASESGYVTSYVGTAWAVIGLVRALPMTGGQHKP
jgi:hypothetical protein